MKRIYLIYCLIIALGGMMVSCVQDTNANTSDIEDGDKVDTLKVDDDLTLDTTEFKSEYDLGQVAEKDREEFKENLKKIEEEHGAQWDFCTCMVKNDSINKAFQNPNLSDAEVDKLMVRFDEIEVRCKASLAQDPNQTPEDRLEHEEKVRNCLKEAGLK